MKGKHMNFRLSLRFFTLFVLSAFTMCAFAATTDTTFKIGTWGNFAQGAVSHTFDDYPYTGTAQQVGTGQAAFDAKGLHMTLFVITGSVTDWSKLKDAFAKGHEIASHTQTHSSNASELKPSQEDIKKNVPGEMCATIAYPNGNTIAGAIGPYIAARNISGANNPKTPTNWAQINTQGFGSGAGGYANDAASMNSWADQAASGNKWATAMHHGIGGPNDPKHSWAMTSIDAMKSHLDYLDQHRDKIWCETFGNVARYIQERDAAKITVKSSAEKSFTITVTDNLADSIFNYPLSIRRELPSGWTTKPIVKQGTKTMSDTIVTVSSKQYLMFQAVPNAGDVVITYGTSTIDRSHSLGFDGSTVVKRWHSSLIIDRNQFAGANLAVTLFDLQGKTIARYNLGTNESRVALPTNKVNHSTFIVKIAGNGKTHVETFFPRL